MGGAVESEALQGEHIGHTDSHVLMVALFPKADGSEAQLLGNACCLHCPRPRGFHGRQVLDSRRELRLGVSEEALRVGEARRGAVLQDPCEGLLLELHVLDVRCSGAGGTGFVLAHNTCCLVLGQLCLYHVQASHALPLVLRALVPARTLRGVLCLCLLGKSFSCLGCLGHPVRHDALVPLSLVGALEVGQDGVVQQPVLQTYGANNVASFRGKVGLEPTLTWAQHS
mmetsp:Transcript_61265/g.197417  ORF Transcript_61265/g.197417 Transcript_61265/m.197417 type:complete len:227 (+) Transcript_61265:597-1277(+)